MNNKTVFVSNFYAILLSSLVGVGLQSCATLKNSNVKEWRTVRVDKKNDEPTWTIHSRKIVGTDFFEYKIVGKIEDSPKDCLASFRQEIYDQADGREKKKYPTYKIVDESNDSLLTYVIHNEPFPMKDTEMSVRYWFYAGTDGSLGISWKEAWEESEIQPSAKLQRVQTFRGSWSFVPTSESSCKAINTVQFDPQKMPMWLVEPMVFKFLKGGLHDLREMTKP